MSGDSRSEAGNSIWGQRSTAWLAAGVGALLGAGFSAFVGDWALAAAKHFGVDSSSILPVDERVQEPTLPAEVEPPVMGDYTGGWGPERAVYTVAQPSPTPALNSITDHPNHGDQRNFVQCMAAHTGDDSYTDELPITEPTLVRVYAVIENASTAGGSDIRGARIRLVEGSSGMVTGLGVVLSADNTGAVWDGCKLFASQPLSTTYVPGSATVHSHLHPDGFPMTDAEIMGRDLFPDTGAGAGVMPASTSNLGYVTLSVVVEPT